MGVNKEVTIFPVTEKMRNVGKFVKCIFGIWVIY